MHVTAQAERMWMHPTEYVSWHLCYTYKQMPVFPSWKTIPGASAVGMQSTVGLWDHPYWRYASAIIFSSSSQYYFILYTCMPPHTISLHVFISTSSSADLPLFFLHFLPHSPPSHFQQLLSISITFSSLIIFLQDGAGLSATLFISTF